MASNKNVNQNQSTFKSQIKDEKQNLTPRIQLTTDDTLTKTAYLSAKREKEKPIRLVIQNISNSSAIPISNVSSIKTPILTSNKSDKNDDEIEKNNEISGRFELAHYAEPSYDELILKQQKYQKQNKNHTYLMEPRQKFKHYLVEKKLFSLIKDLFDTRCPVYDPNEAKTCCRILSDSARNLVKTLKFERYKYVVHTFVVQKIGQSIVFASRALLSSSTDCYLTQKYEANDYIVICVLHAIYHE